MPRMNITRQMPNRLREILNEYGKTTADLKMEQPLSSSTMSEILNRDWLPGKGTRGRLIQALTTVTGKQFTESDVWPNIATIAETIDDSDEDVVK